MVVVFFFSLSLSFSYATFVSLTSPEAALKHSHSLNSNAMKQDAWMCSHDIDTLEDSSDVLPSIDRGDR